METGTFDWRTLGKADYAQASALVSSLPEDIRSKLDGVAREVLCRIIHLGWTRAQGSGTGAAYCFPRLTTLGRYCNRSARTVQRALSKLSRLGLVSWRHRMTKSGDNTSNLYQAGKTLLASLFARKNKKSPIKPVTTKLSYNDLKREYKAAPNTGEPASLSAYLQKHRAKPIEPLEATQSEGADWGEEENTAVEERRAFIKAQFAAMQRREA